MPLADKLQTKISETITFRKIEHNSYDLLYSIRDLQLFRFAVIKRFTSLRLPESRSSLLKSKPGNATLKIWELLMWLKKQLLS